MKEKTNKSRYVARNLNCSPEQVEFAELVQRNKGKIFDADVVLKHRGAEVLFGGAGPKALRYKIAISGYSDKDEVEEVPMYLDWDDSALYDEGGIADQIRDLLSIPLKGKTRLTPAIKAGA